MDPIVIAIIIAASIVALTVILYLTNLFLTAPCKRRPEIEKYKSVKFAHRGLHGNGVAENSLTAFRLAKEAGFGIELDVRLAKDGKLVVFHDDKLTRVTGIDKRVIDLTTEELSKIQLSGTEDTVPTFREVLDLIDGEIPMLIEIKLDEKESGVAERFLEEIDGYHGEFIIESFNPLALRTVKQARPDILRGILSTTYSQDPKYKGRLLYKLLESLRLNFLMRPDFIAYEKTGYKVKALRAVRHSFKTPLFAWTVRSAEEEQNAIAHGFDTVIFENYIPNKI